MEVSTKNLTTPYFDNGCDSNVNNSAVEENILEIINSREMFGNRCNKFAKENYSLQQHRKQYLALYRSMTRENIG